MRERDPTSHFELAGSFHINVPGFGCASASRRDVEAEVEVEAAQGPGLHKDIHGLCFVRGNSGAEQLLIASDGGVCMVRPFEKPKGGVSDEVSADVESAKLEVENTQARNCRARHTRVRSNTPRLALSASCARARGAGRR